MADAILMAHWPGKDVPICLEHAEKLNNVAGALGLRVSMSPIGDAGVTCTNCENEAKLTEKSNG